MPHDPENDPDQPDESAETFSRELKAAQKGDAPQSPWSVVAHNKKVLKGWEQLVRNTPQNAINAYDWLRRHPTKSMPGRCYALKHKKYAGHWCYEIGSGDRVYYRPDDTNRTVTVWYAGSHPNAVPTPPESL